MVYKRIATSIIAVMSLGISSQTAQAQDDFEATNTTSDANNPLAETTSFNIQNYYIGKFTESNQKGNQFVLRYGKPVSIGKTNWLARASLPINSLPVNTDGTRETGIGDFDIFASYLFKTGDPKISFGIGPQVVLPTATDDRLGAEQLQLGLANVYFNARSEKFQYGYLLTYRAGVGDTNGRDRVSLAALQPFLVYQLEKGWYTGMAPLWGYNFKNDSYSIPVGLRLGKVIQKNKTVFNFFVEPQYSIFDKGPGQPKWQIYFAVNMQFSK